MIRVSNLKLDIEEREDVLKDKIKNRLKLKDRDLISYQIFKKSIDARKREQIYFIYTVDVQVSNELMILKKNYPGISKTPDMEYIYPEPGKEKLVDPPVIVGTGPSGLFAGLILSQLGYKPILLERGEEVDARSAKVNQFWTHGSFDQESNVQFGEGGAGTFSDGKLTTLIKDKRCRKVLKEFVKAGAPEEIIYQNKPHVGTDLLKSVVINIRNQIIRNGGEVRFKAKVTDFIIKDYEIRGLVINESEKIKCNTVLLGIGHSARDTFRTLNLRGVKITPKPFSIGVRIEHPQKLIDHAQYGKFAGHSKLGAADYKLVYHGKEGRTAYTFCMCPGGYVVAATSEEDGVVVNGMSEYKRDGENANAALLVGVTPQDYGSDHPLAGIEFQKRWEHLAFSLAGKNYHAPVQLVGDFLADRPSTRLGMVKPTYKPGVQLVELKDCLPNYVINTIKEAIPYFASKIQGFDMPEALMTGVETRSSSPVRINRDENFESSIKGLYPMGEGAGYAGGIISSAVDGIKVAEKIITRYSPYS